MSPTSPFSTPEFGIDRGIRRLTINLRKANLDYETAHREAVTNDNQDNRLIANSLRREMIELYDELLLHITSSEPLCSNREDVLAETAAILARCPTFSEERLSGDRQPPPLSSTISAPGSLDVEAPAVSQSAPVAYTVSHLIGQLQTSCLSYEIATDPTIAENPDHVLMTRNSLLSHRRSLADRLSGQTPCSVASAAFRRASILLGEEETEYQRESQSVTANATNRQQPSQSQPPPIPVDSHVRANTTVRDRSSHRPNLSGASSRAESSERYASLHDQLMHERRQFEQQLRDERHRQDNNIRRERRRYEQEVEEIRNAERRRYDDELARLQNQRVPRLGSSRMSLAEANMNNNRSTTLFGSQFYTPQRNLTPMDLTVPTSHVAMPHPLLQAPAFPTPAYTTVFSNPAPVVSSNFAPAVVPASSGSAIVPGLSVPTPAATHSGTFATSAPSVPPAAPAIAVDPLLEIQTQSHAFSMIMQKRPKIKFSGENKKLDFESYLHKFETTTAVPGCTDAMRVAEMPHWFTGNAGLIVDRFVSEPDATKGLSLALKALKKEFGRKTATAKQMLQELLAGDRIPERDFSTLKTSTS